MLAQIKTDFYNLLRRLGYNVTDSGTYEEKFPWLMLRTNQYELKTIRNTEQGKIALILDIFSQYQGEKEIIEIIENIAEHLNELYAINKTIIYCQQKTVQILEDNTHGPIRKHGVINYEFSVAREGVEATNVDENVE